MKKIALLSALLLMPVVYGETNDKVVRSLYLDAERSAESGDTEAALKFLELALKEKPKYPEALFLRGKIYYEMKKKKEAVVDLKKCVEAIKGSKKHLGKDQLDLLKKAQDILRMADVVDATIRRAKNILRTKAQEIKEKDPEGAKKLLKTIKKIDAEEIENTTPKQPEKESPKIFTGKWKYLSNGRVYTFNADGIASSGTGVPGTWSKVRGSIVVKWNNNIVDTIKIPTIWTGKSSNGKSFSAFKMK